MSNLIVTQAQKLGAIFGIEGDGQELVQILKATAFKGQVSDAQMAALMMVASQYQLNPFTRELYAFPDRQNGIVPVVGVDGWSRIINNHPQFDGMDFEQDAESCTCIIYRKDRGHPIKVTEWMAECRREGVGPWKSHPRRMLRHKAMIQCARLAFGYTGIFDQDEAERIQEATSHAAPAPSAPEASPQLLEAAQDAASDGVESYKTFWQSAAQADRQALARHHAALKKVAESADADRTVTDVDVREVPHEEA